MWFENSWGRLGLKEKYSYSPLNSENFIVRWRRVRMWLQGHCQSSLAQWMLKAHRTCEHSSPRKCGQSLGIPGLKWLKQLCFHMEGTAAHEKEKPHQSKYWEVSTSSLKRKKITRFFLFFFPRKQLEKRWTQPQNQPSKKASSTWARKDGEVWGYPTVHTPGGGSK